jgi:hypothetical protein
MLSGGKNRQFWEFLEAISRVFFEEYFLHIGSICIPLCVLHLQVAFGSLMFVILWTEMHNSDIKGTVSGDFCVFFYFI